MGLFDRLFGKQAGNEDVQPSAQDRVTQPQNEMLDYSVLPEIAAILTRNNERAVREIGQLAESLSVFSGAHHEWIEGMDFEFCESDDRQGATLLIFAYWLIGYSPAGDDAKDPMQFGAYIDWKEETDDILWGLGKADENLNYGLALNEMQFSYEESTDEVLQMIDNHLTKKGMALTHLDTQSDCYHLFVLRGEDYERLTQLSKKVNFRFTRNFE